ncbi:MAG TPA: hypothetical protein VEJ41_08615 [Candidatus Acidoferrales bacterium]|nr:hypothetical protein [Candidatus Acidoferrales bacterium]
MKPGIACLCKLFSACFAFIAALLMSTPGARADDAGYLWSYILNDSYSSDTFYSADFTKPFGASSPIRPFGELLLQRDSRTVGGVLPQTLNDNYGLAALGLQYQSAAGLRIFGQVGSSFAFGPATPSTATTKHFDWRGGTEYYRDWSDQPGTGHRVIGSFYGDVIYYSRYKNAILYFQAERGREFGKVNHPIQAYARLSGSQDTRRYYYNEVVALTGGVRYLPFGRTGPSFALEEAYSNYLAPGAALASANVARDYWSFRPTLTFGTNF